MKPRYHRLSLCLSGLTYPSFNGRALHRPTLHRNRMRRSSPSAASNESFIEPHTIHEITIELPLGVTLEEEIDSSYSSNVAPSSGVAIIGIHENGNAAIYNSNIFSKLKPTLGNSNSNRNVRNDCICIRDRSFPSTVYPVMIRVSTMSSSFYPTAVHPTSHR